MNRISQFLLGFLVLGVIFSCARTPQRIELHPVYVIPRGTPEGPGLPLGVAEGLDTEKVKASTVRVAYGEGGSTMISSGFFVANDKIATNIHVVAEADLAWLYVRTDNADFTIRGVTAFDAQNDLVILQISGTGVPFILSNSDAVSSGETVFCVGYVGYPADLKPIKDIPRKRSNTITPRLKTLIRLSVTIDMIHTPTLFADIQEFA